MSCDAWKWISANASDEIRPEDDCFVSWQHVRLWNLTLFHLQNKACHLRSLHISHDKDLNMISNPNVSTCKGPDSGTLVVAAQDTVNIGVTL